MSQQNSTNNSNDDSDKQNKFMDKLNHLRPGQLSTIIIGYSMFTGYSFFKIFSHKYKKEFSHFLTSPARIGVFSFSIATGLVSLLGTSTLWYTSHKFDAYSYEELADNIRKQSPIYRQKFNYLFSPLEEKIKAKFPSTQKDQNQMTKQEEEEFQRNLEEMLEQAKSEGKSTSLTLIKSMFNHFLKSEKKNEKSNIDDDEDNNSNLKN